MKKFQQHIAVFYIAFLLLFKVAGLHAFAHHADDAEVQHCEVCHIITAVNFIPLLETSPTVITQTVDFLGQQQFRISTDELIFCNRHLESYLFTRPPPHLA